MLVIFISNKFFNLIRKNSSQKKYLKENNIYHYSYKCDLVEYNFKDIYKTFNISYFSKNSKLIVKFVNPQNLKDYETIEKNTDGLSSVLIKKFKFRISFKKSDDFSREIVICDDYELNPDGLSHSEDLIKIAIVKDNPNKWSNSNLNGYNYIFVLDKYSDNFTRNNTFVLKGTTVYECIKYILNELYRRKADKFHYFLKNIHFQKVFPNEKGYFKVLNSEFFDDEWYRKTYDLKDNTDSVIHFLLIGHSKGNNPGPNFSTHEYYECNKDVEIVGMNPLLHYETYGRKENRIFKISDIPQRNYSKILNSEYFDEDWYKSTYGINDVDAADHYLNVGYAKGYNPSSDFSTFEYYERNRDVKEVRINPLLHYELYGRGENRELKLADERYDEFYSSILNSPYFDEDWYKSTYDIGDWDSAGHYLKVGFTLDYNPGPNFSTREYYDCNIDVEEYGMNPLAHYEIYGRDEGRKLNPDED